MVNGLDKFREYFKDHSDNYVIIGGTACDLILTDAGLTARVTTDIDIILVIEALNAEFVKQFWEFINAGKYERSEESQGEKKHYRFLKPATEGFPYQVELFSKVPDILTIYKNVRLTPIPVDDDLSSLSAILMNEEYYKYVIEHSSQQREVKRANTEALICLKSFAYLNMKKQKDHGEKIDSNNIKKHRSDVFRLMLMLPAYMVYEVPPSIKANLQEFADAVKNELPDKNFFKSIGAPNIQAAELFQLFTESFGLM
jgi:hypothetical protein